jgi:hypothetical protein
MKLIKLILAVPATIIGTIGLSFLFAFLTIKICGEKLIQLTNAKLG